MKTLLLLCALLAAFLAGDCEKTCEEPEQPCDEGLVWNHMVCKCVPQRRIRPLEGLVSPLVCHHPCPPGSKHNSRCECYTKDCTAISAMACEKIKCGENSESYCGLGRHMPEDPDVPPDETMLYCAGCGCCSTGSLGDDPYNPLGVQMVGRQRGRRLVRRACSEPCPDVHSQEE